MLKKAFLHKIPSGLRENRKTSTINIDSLREFRCTYVVTIFDYYLKRGPSVFLRKMTHFIHFFKRKNEDYAISFCF
jgi:hypothetical protein